MSRRIPEIRLLSSSKLMIILLMLMIFIIKNGLCINDPMILKDDNNVMIESSSLKYTNELLTEPMNVQIDIGEIVSFSIHLKKPSIEPISIKWECEGKSGCTTFNETDLPDTFNLKNNETIEINFTAKQAGHDCLIFQIVNNDTEIDDRNAFVRIRIGRSQFLYYLGQFWGWGYFFIWSLSFWPQNFTNYRRKSVVGLSFDYTTLHFTGFLFYSIFNVSLFYWPLVQEQYEEKFPRSEIPVEFNDVVYALHAALSTSITFTQLFIYERGDQHFSLFSKLFQTIVWSIGGLFIILCLFEVTTWLTFIYYFSYIKLLVTSIKYLPQLYFNFIRKSTRGWTIYMVLLDITGGSFSMLQMITNGYNYNDWKILVGNLPKFGLGLASVFYDILFLLQHYVFFRKNNLKIKLQEEEERKRQQQQQQPKQYGMEQNEKQISKTHYGTNEIIINDNHSKKKQSNTKTLCAVDSTAILVDNLNDFDDYSENQN